MRRVLANLAVVAGTLLILLPVAELSVRILAPQTLGSQSRVREFVTRGMFVPWDRPTYRPTPSFSGTLQISGHVTESTTNSLGLRDEEPGPKGRHRILAFGDSFTFGWGVPQGEEWIRVADREMDDALGRDGVQAVNCGVIGYGTENALAWMETMAAELQPDTILFGFFSNDFLDDFIGAAHLYTVRDGYLFDQYTHDAWKESFLLRHSHLWRLLGVAKETARVRWFGAQPAQRPVRDFSDDDFRIGMERAWQNLQAMQRLSEELGARFAVVFFPADVYVVPRAEPHVELRIELIGRVREAGIPVLDLMGPLRAERDPAGLYLPRDGHFTVRGNRVAGRLIARWLLEEVLPDSLSG